MKKLNVFVIALILLLAMTNFGYASQKQLSYSSSKVDITFSENIQNSKIVQITQPSIKLTNKQNKKCEVKDLSVIDSVYDKNGKSTSNVTTTTDVTTKSISVDLCINSLTAATQPFKVGQDADFQFEIANYGTGTAPNTYIGFEMDGNSLGFNNIGNIPSGYQYTVNFTLTGVPEGTHEIKVVAVPDSSVIDINPNNNSIAKNFVWQGVPDLVAKSFVTVSEPTLLTPGKEVIFEFSVANEGTGKAVGTINNHLSINGQELGIISFPGLDVGYIATITFGVTFNAPGTYNMAIHVNKDGTIIESDYNNNIKTKNVEILNRWSNFINGDPVYVYFSITEITPRGPIVVPAGITASGCWQEEWIGGLGSYINELDELLQCAIVYSKNSIPFVIEALYPTAKYNNDSYAIDDYQSWVLENPDNRYTSGVSFVSKDYDITNTDSYGYVVIYAPGTNQITQGISYYWDIHV